MARGGGSIRSGGVYHLISRFVAKEWFIESAVERGVYRAILGNAIQKTDWSLLAYAMMSSHIHLAVVAGTVPLVHWMRPMHTHFASWLNERRQRIGGVFVRGPNVIEFRPDGVAHLVDYIHRNPMRAGVVSTTNDSDWTSHRAYVELEPHPRWLDVERGLRLIGMSPPEFRAWSSAVCTDSTTLEDSRKYPRRPRGRPPARKSETPWENRRK